MEEETRVYEIKKIMNRQVEEGVERIIFEKESEGWVYKAPNAQTHTEGQIEEILKKLKELNSTNGAVAKE